MKARKLKSWYHHYKAGYLRYLRKLGYGDHSGEFDLFFITRAFILCWAKPGFHYFWRYWNPGIGYMTHRLYHNLGGNRNRTAATLLTFLINGLVHNAVLSPFLGWSFTLPVTFLCFGILSVVSEKLQPVLRQKYWHWILNTGVNLFLVVLSFDIGFRADNLLFHLFMG